MAKNLLAVTAVLEMATGLALLVVPAQAGVWLLGQPLDGLARPVAGVAGIALIGLGIGCWPGPAIVGMLAYGGLVALYLAFLGLTGLAGILLWPAVILHVGLTILLGREWTRARARGA